jgi:hypothetical protein
MSLTVDDLRCSNCGAFVHPLLEVCPSCGTARQSRRPEAAAGAIGALRLAEAPETQGVARNLTMRYTMKVNAIGSGPDDATLVEAVTRLAEAVTYRIAGDAIPDADNASLTLREESLVAEARPSGALLAEIPLAAIVGTAARHGEVTVFYAPGAAAPGAGRRTGPPATVGLVQVTVSNRRGLLAARARDDHFAALALWLAVLAGAEAERRWMQVGLPAYLAEIDPAVAGATGPTPGIGQPDDAARDGRVASSASVTEAMTSPRVQDSLVELESLRRAGLVDEEEYAAKRREILARL